MKLNLTRSPYWIDLALGVRVEVKPVGTTLMLEVRRDPEVRALANTVAPDDDPEEWGLVMTRALARAAICDWEGVEGEDGQPLPIAPRHVDALMEEFPIFEAFQERYAAPAWEFEQEGNGLPASPNGNSVEAGRTATTARKRAKRAQGRSTAH